jgi:hypothetical protein
MVIKSFINSLDDVIDGSAKAILTTAVIKEAKAMEKKQIENAHLSGLLQPLEMEATKQAEQYYNETYGKGIL